MKGSKARDETLDVSTWVSHGDLATTRYEMMDPYLH